LREPALLLPGDRFIIRMFSPVVTIGGGVVLDAGVHRYRKGESVAARLDVLASPDAGARLALLAQEAPFGMGMVELAARTGMRARDVDNAARKTELVIVPQPLPWYVDRSWFTAAQARLIQTVRAFHQKNPLLPGIAKQELRSRDLAEAPPFLLDFLLEGAKELVVEGETVRSRGHKLVLKEDEEQARRAIERAFEKAGLSTPAVAEVLAHAGVEAGRARSLLQILLREQRLIRVSDDLVFHRAAIEGLRRMLAARKSTRFTVSAFKDWTGISRKYAIPLLEYLDREHITRRDGEERVIL
jgi:selenocysteine-specific elongation factor